MKKQNRHILCAAVLAVALLLALLTGCGAAPDGPAPAPDSGPEATVDTPAPEPGTDTAPPAEDNAIHVSSAEELFDAIAPGVEIIIEPGYYNLSEFLEGAMASNRTFPNVTLNACFDGTEAIISDIDTFTIRGDSTNAADTELVIDPRYGTVLTFERCNDFVLANLTLGHTESSDCAGSVLSFYECSSVELGNLDLYGCGIYAVNLKYGCSDFLIQDCILRDCDYGPFNIEDAAGPITFVGCDLSGSNGSGHYDPTDDSTLSFSDCSFGQAESNVWYFSEDIITENCTWSEITEYPDYSYMEYEEGT